MVTSAIYAIGSELVRGQIIDTNSAFISGRLGQLGIDVLEITLLPDQENHLVEAIQSALSRYDLVVTTGGLGPTFDDLTAESVSKATGRPCEFNAVAYTHIEKLLTGRNVELKETHRHQAFLPSGAVLLPNSMGTAYGFAVELENTVIVSLPGVPFEMQPMVEAQLIPYLNKRFHTQPRYTDVLRFAGRPESDVDEQIRRIGIPDGLECIINASQGEILVRLMSQDQDQLTRFAHSLQKSLASDFIGAGDLSAAHVLIDQLRKYEETLAVAESLTGGQIGQTITAVAGASDIFIAGLVVYSNWAKIKHLDVPQQIIQKHGPVSYECALAMVRNTIRKFETDAAIAVTGIAGPSGGSAENPVGTVYIAWYYRDRLRAKRYHFPGDRVGIRDRTVKIALTELIKLIRETRTGPE
ncbi:CinA family nicotinamide mononucleotide deamidase-related protein [bacterium]|nr:CinA family nicotinamide mononucleotide deamidase-related protein [bacterium]